MRRWRLAAGGAVHRGDLDGAVVLDVDGGAGLLGDLADHRAALADDVADLLRVDLQRDDRRRPLGHLGARLADDLVHLAEDVQAAVARLVQRDLHDLRRDALDLDVHLQRGDAVAGAGDLEIHVAEVILVAEDVGQHLEARCLPSTRPMATPATGALIGTPASISDEAGAAHARHGAGAVGLEDFRDHADHVREGAPCPASRR